MIKVSITSPQIGRYKGVVFSYGAQVMEVEADTEQAVVRVVAAFVSCAKVPA